MADKNLGYLQYFYTADVELEGFLAVKVTNLYNLTEACENETRQTMPRHHSEDSGVFDDENDWTQLNLVKLSLLNHLHPLTSLNVIRKMHMWKKACAAK